MKRLALFCFIGAGCTQGFFSRKGDLLRFLSAGHGFFELCPLLRNRGFLFFCVRERCPLRRNIAQLRGEFFNPLLALLNRALQALTFRCQSSSFLGKRIQLVFPSLQRFACLCDFGACHLMRFSL